VSRKVAGNVLLLAACSGIGSTKVDLCSKAKQNVLLLNAACQAAIAVSNC